MSVKRYPEVRVGLSSNVIVTSHGAYATVIPTDAQGEVVGDDIQSQSKQCFANLRDVLAEAGRELDSIAHLTIYLTDIAQDRDGFNEVYAEMFAGSGVPVRCAVGVAALARPTYLVELTAITA